MVTKTELDFSEKDVDYVLNPIISGINCGSF